MKVLKWGLLTLVVLGVLSSLVLWSWGQFARRAMGEPSGALAVHATQTAMDRWVAPLLTAHPDLTGATLITDNLTAFAVRVLSAREAERSLDVQYYLWHDDLTGRMLKDELVAAAERGVRVRMLVDDMNGLGLDESFLAMDAHPNLEVRLFNPARNRETAWRRALEMGLRFFTFNRRMHNKSWTVDGRMALVGGRNVGDEYFNAAAVNFHDADLMMIGPGVAQTSAVFDSFWNSNAVIPLAAMHPMPGDLVHLSTLREGWRAAAKDSPYATAVANVLSQPQALFNGARHHWVRDLRVLSDPPSKAGPIALNRAPERWLKFDVLQALFSAQRELRLISPYFVPGDAGTLLFTGLAARQVDVGILTNSLAANDVPAVHAGYQRYRKPLLLADVKLWELKPGSRSAPAGSDPSSAVDGKSGLLGSSGASLHTKAFVVDRERGFVGSFNFDPRSASLNTEMGVMFAHPGLADDVLKLFDASKSAQNSFTVRLDEQGELVWHDPETNRVWMREPEASWFKRTLTSVLSHLPIESQL